MKNLLPRNTLFSLLIFTTVFAFGIYTYSKAENPLASVIFSEGSEGSLEFQTETVDGTVVDALQEVHEVVVEHGLYNPVANFLNCEEEVLKNQAVMRWFYRVIVGYLKKSYPSYFEDDATVNDLLQLLDESRAESILGMEQCLTYIDIEGQFASSEAKLRDNISELVNTLSFWKFLRKEQPNSIILTRVEAVFDSLEQMLRKIHPSLSVNSGNIHKTSYEFIVRNLLRKKKILKAYGLRRTSLYLMVMFYELKKHYLHIAEVTTEESIITKGICGLLFIRFFLDSWAQNICTNVLHKLVIPPFCRGAIDQASPSPSVSSSSLFSASPRSRSSSRCSSRNSSRCPTPVSTVPYKPVPPRGPREHRPAPPCRHRYNRHGRRYTPTIMLQS